MKFIVFGLGNYGASLGSKLTALGHEVIGVDHNIEVTEKWKDHITHTITMDASSREAMLTLPLKDVDAAVISIGETPGINIMVAALVKQLGVKRIICRVISPLQHTVLESMNIEEFAYPEADSAERMAYKLDLKGVVESYKISDDYQLLEVEVPSRYIGAKVGAIKFTDTYLVQLVSVIRTEEQKNIFGASHSVRRVQGIPDPEFELKKGDTLLLFGNVKQLEEFIEY
ncbi:MAG TPA: TrkA family potassium uptake protein [Cyclobacteriaceae bacterium]|nr:TrkA family potassium uptake protein [Cyclobacteriaceae bacterium]